MILPVDPGSDERCNVIDFTQPHIIEMHRRLYFPILIRLGYRICPVLFITEAFFKLFSNSTLYTICYQPNVWLISWWRRVCANQRYLHWCVKFSSLGENKMHNNHQIIFLIVSPPLDNFQCRIVYTCSYICAHTRVIDIPNSCSEGDIVSNAHLFHMVISTWACAAILIGLWCTGCRIFIRFWRFVQNVHMRASVMRLAVVFFIASSLGEFWLYRYISRHCSMVCPQVTNTYFRDWPKFYVHMMWFLQGTSRPVYMSGHIHRSWKQCP